MWKYCVLLVCLSGYCLAGPVLFKRNIPIGVQQRGEDAATPMENIAESESASSSSAAEPSQAEMMIMSTLTLPSNATSIRADITDNFSCENKTYGYYADVDNDCQIFHVCLPVTYADGKENTFRWSFICPEETVFSQDSFTCMRPEDMTITCDESYNYYELNRNFGMVNQEPEKENINEPAVEQEADDKQPSENTIEAEPQPEIIMEEPIKAVEQPIKVQSKPNRRKPGLSYAAEKKPVNTIPLRKMPQYQPQINAIKNQQNLEVKETAKPVEEEEIKPVVQKFQTRRPAPSMSNTFKDKIQSSKPETMFAIRSDLYSQKRKRPTVFNKKPIEEEKTEEEPAKEESVIEEKVPEQSFSPVESEVSNGSAETQVADSEVQASQAQEVFVKASPNTNKPEEEPQVIESEPEPIQVLEAFEEIPAVIAEVIENGEEDTKKVEDIVPVEETQNETVDETPIIEAEQTATNEAEEIQASEAEATQTNEAEETKVSEAVETPTFEVEKTQTIESEGIQTNEAEDTQTNEAEDTQTNEAEDTQTNETEESQTANEMTAVENSQPMAETQAIEEVVPQVEEETLNVQEPETAETEVQTAEEVQTADETKNSEQPQVIETPQTSEEIQNNEEIKNNEEIQNNEEPQNNEEVKPSEENTSAEEVMPAEQILTPEQPQPELEAEITPEEITVDETKPAEESTIVEESKPIEENQETAEVKPLEAESAEESKPAEDIEVNEPAEETQVPEQVMAIDSPAPAEDIKQEQSEEIVDIKSALPVETEAIREQPEAAAAVAAEPAIFEENSEEAAPAIVPVQPIEEMEAEKPAEAPESMPATEEMAEHDPIVQEMFEETNDENDKKQTIGGFKPVDPVMAAEAEQLIADFINTLRKNDFTNEQPAPVMPMQVSNVDETEEQSAQEPVQVDETQELLGQAEESVAEKDEQPQIIDDNKTDEVEDNKEPQEVAEVEKIVSDSNEEVSFLKSAEVHNSEETQPQEEQSVGVPISVPDMIMSHMPHEVYQIPVEVVAAPVEEVPEVPQMVEDGNAPVALPETNAEENNEQETPAVIMGGYKPLSIDDIVELVKERLDQKPKDEMETPMQLDQVLSEIKPSMEKTENQPIASAVEEQQAPEVQQTSEEIVMPIYHRLAGPATVDAGVQTDSEDLTAVDDDDDTVAAPSTQEKTNRSYRSRSMLKAKLDPRKRRFLFRSDDS